MMHQDRMLFGLMLYTREVTELYLKLEMKDS